jgi:serine/threonine protein kinase/tetratricopeptide (TPR) repeat protein
MREAFERELAVFSAARRLPPPERASYLDQTCAGDAALRRRVEELLQASEDAEGFLQEPAPGAQRTDSPSPASTLVPNVAASGEKAGDRIGHYKLLQQIGEGGCGVVYMAEQEEPVRRQVALKVIKLGMDTKNVIARFEAERQALALMDHPNIAKVLDAGATETGRPYFVMELVRGIKITDYCDQNKLPTRERLALFVQVCQAIQHAHQKGIIHRDIKPSNILVTQRDGVPVPKVIDFGIAKATTDQRLTDKTLFTAFEQFIGTPAYMSPEQAEMSELGIDTRSDIYSLGVLLYELLTGQTPFDAKELLQGGLDVMRRTIREQEPVRPSTRLSTLLEAEQTRVASHRQTDALKLVNLLRGDLDWIVVKSLEKDRARRYETVNGLARDVQRYLDDEPIMARPPSNLYKFQKLIGRNKLIFFSVAAVAVALMIGITVSVWQAVRATRAEREQRVLREQAQAKETKAKAEALKSQLTANFLGDMLLEIDADVANGQEKIPLRRILDRAAERVHIEMTSQPSAQADLLTTVGAIYLRIGLYTQAETMYREALDLRRKTGRDQAEIAISMNNLGHALSRQSKKSGEAEKLFRGALTILRNEHGEENADLAVSLSGLADSLGSANRRAEAEVLCREVLAMRKKLYGEENFQVSSAMHDLAFNLRKEGKLGEAETLSRQELALRRKLLGGDHNSSVAWSLCSLGDVLLDEGHSVDAETMYRQALTIQHKILGHDNPETVTTLYHIGRLLLMRGDRTQYGEAESLLREAMDKRRQIYGQEHPYFISTMVDLVFLLLAEKNFAEAHPMILELAEKGNVFFQVRLGLMYQAGTGIPQDSGLAEKWFTKAIQNTNSSSLKNAAWAMVADPNPAPSNAPLAVALAERAVSLDHRQNDGTLDTLAAAYSITGQFEKAISAENEAISFAHDAMAKRDYESRLKLYQSHSLYQFNGGDWLAEP